MSQYNQNQAQVPYSYPTAVEQGPYAAPPPPAGYPTKEGELGQAQNYPPSGKTQSRGDGFWKGCCAALCCCCVLDACF